MNGPSDMPILLKPCPFCGHAPQMYFISSTVIRCGNDQCISRFDLGGFNSEIHRQEAIAAWNTRHEPEGWILVPREPTPSMLRAGFLSENECFDIEVPADAPGLVYRAMIEAAPNDSNS